ncbi:phage tail sheath subtilisin-like domain-containing protein [Deltaproteobacteria bacterium OttesenSCG-928-M10]|nr:phage tail sheath subtilisin-like domain-containing protein [Deltaproteobacteria bacterium OttesenSCG-928-M10]
MSGIFSELPDALRLPFAYTEFDPSQADRGLSEMPFNVLLVGQMFETGEAEPLTLQRPTTTAQADRLFGAGSQLSQMAAGYLGANRLTRMMALGVNDFDGGTAATGTLTISGEVTVATPLCLYVGGVLVRLGVGQGQTAETVAGALAIVVNSKPGLAVTAAAGENAGEVIFTAKHKGECGNNIDLRLNYQGEESPGGLTFAFTAMAGGSGNPDAAEVVAAMGSERFHVIAWPWNDADSLRYLKEELDSRWGPLRQNDGQAILVKPGTFVECTTFASSQNNKHLTVFPAEGSPTLPWVYAAVLMAITAYYGADDPARPFQTLTLPGVLPGAVSDRWSDFPEKNQALYEGLSVCGVNDAGQVMILRAITTYRTNAWGAETQAYLDLNTMLTLSYLRYDWNNYLQTKYPRHKLAGDDEAKRYGPHQPIMTPKLGRAEAIARFRVWMRAGLVEAPDDFESRLVVERNADNPNRLDWLMMPDLVNQFRVAGTLVRFLL